MSWKEISCDRLYHMNQWGAGDSYYVAQRLRLCDVSSRYNVLAGEAEWGHRDEIWEKEKVPPLKYQTSTFS